MEITHYSILAGREIRVFNLERPIRKLSQDHKIYVNWVKPSRSDNKDGYPLVFLFYSARRGVIFLM